jgi:hypothetical protein
MVNHLLYVPDEHVIGGPPSMTHYPHPVMAAHPWYHSTPYSDGL